MCLANKYSLSLSFSKQNFLNILSLNVWMTEVLKSVCSTDCVTLDDTYQYDDSAAKDTFHREPYCVRFRLRNAGEPARLLLISFYS